MSAILQSASTATMHRVSSSDSLKSQIVSSDVSISPSKVTPVKLSLPRVPVDRPVSPSDSMDSRIGASRKRTSQFQVLSPTSLKRRTGDLTPQAIKMEGELTIVEQINHPDAPSIQRSVGTHKCRLARHLRGFWLETMSDFATPSPPLRLQLEYMAIEVTTPHQDSTFSLRCSGKHSSTAKSFHFTAASAEDSQRWVGEITQATASSSSETSDSTRSVEGVEQDSSTMRVCRQERPAKRGGLVYSIPPKITHIILVRHGHYVNAHAKGISDSDQVLSQMGRQQAELTGKYLEELFHRCPSRNQQVTIYHSDLTRAVETATVLGKNFVGSSTPIPSELLREGWPGQPFASEQMPSQLMKRSEEEQELDRQDTERMEQAYEKFFAETVDDDDGSFRVIVCHANLIRFLLCRALQIAPHAVWGHFEINHCGVTRIDICRNRPLKVMAMNETGHLPHSLITSSEDHL
ncbi:hypothetical protein Poli38472_008693 [Pythium oligandrum]|uniref:Serine/threonine-protein phosphatase PGAM5, mitochondrial n=1 Tax=Pythium oligandrum TaxID=41045 RepID=A0A8K1C440_PYTOL|nr:hypothetical protein Poli38472_008693 [Pythium oligandrum]|eukprot:TMW56045.1 hypothetical protein Poli38472_008693 [Pythium oligandrum]